MKFQLSLVTIVFAILTNTLAANTYRIDSGPGFDGSLYSFSGTITTDGSITRTADSVNTGCLSGNCIVSWSVQVNTPGDNDGTTSQILNEQNSMFILAERPGSDSFVSVSESELHLGFGRNTSAVFSLVSTSGDERIDFIGTNRSTSLGMIRLSDPSEVPAEFSASYMADADGVFPFATVVPEPTSLTSCSLCCILAALAVSRRKRR